MARGKVAPAIFSWGLLFSALPEDQQMTGLGQRMRVQGTQSYHRKAFPPSLFGEDIFPLQILP